MKTKLYVENFQLNVMVVLCYH